MSLQDGRITGTDADLRRLTMPETEEILVKYGILREAVKAITNRWVGWAGLCVARGWRDGVAGGAGGARASATKADQRARASCGDVFDVSCVLCLVSLMSCFGWPGEAEGRGFQWSWALSGLGGSCGLQPQCWLLRPRGRCR